MQAVQKKLAELQAQFEENNRKKLQLERDVDLCSKKLDRCIVCLQTDETKYLILCQINASLIFWELNWDVTLDTAMGDTLMPVDWGPGSPIYRVCTVKPLQSNIKGYRNSNYCSPSVSPRVSFLFLLFLIPCIDKFKFELGLTDTYNNYGGYQRVKQTSICNTLSLSHLEVSLYLSAPPPLQGREADRRAGWGEGPVGPGGHGPLHAVQQPHGGHPHLLRHRRLPRRLHVCVQTGQGGPVSRQPCVAAFHSVVLRWLPRTCTLVCTARPCVPAFHSNLIVCALLHELEANVILV